MKMGSSQVYLIGAVFLYALLESGHALSCWTCSSDLDISCGDHFNTTQILQQRSYYRNVDYQNQNYQGGNNYGNQPAYGNQQYGNQQYGNQQYGNQQYGSNNNNNNYGNNQFGNSGNNRMPSLMMCDNNVASLRSQKQVCRKKVFNMPDGRRIVSRDCLSVSDRTYAGRCPTEITGRGTSVEFCEYCEYDGCNSATGLRTNFALALMLPCALLYFLRK